MAETPVDIVIPCFNGERTLAQTIECALAQTHRPLRILVVDDGSTDSSRRIVESFEGRVGYLFKENGGQASARNLGIARTQAPFICLLDADDLPAPNMIERLLGTLEAEPGAGLAHGDVLGFWGDDFRHPHAEFWRPAADWTSYLEPLSILCAVHGSATLIRRSVFESCGAFPEARSLQGCEDWHFWLQAVIQGTAFRRVPEVLCLYRYHASASSSSGRAVARRETNLMRSAGDLFRRHAVVRDEQRAVLAVGAMSVAARWLALGDLASFEEGRALALETGPLDALAQIPAASGRGALQASLLNLRLAGLLLDLGHPVLAAILFLRCRDWPALRAEVGGTSDAGTLERVSGAVSDVVQAEMERPSTEPSYATHLATALGVLALASGKLSRAREGFEQACALDPGNLLPALELIALDSRHGRFGSAAIRWRRLGERQDPDVPADRLRRVARALAVRSIQRHPGLREAARGLASRLASLRFPPRRS